MSPPTVTSLGRETTPPEIFKSASRNDNSLNVKPVPAVVRPTLESLPKIVLILLVIAAIESSLEVLVEANVGSTST